MEDLIHHLALDAARPTILFMMPYSRHGNTVYPHKILWMGRMPDSHRTGP
jgi:hypothetical protein